MLASPQHPKAPALMSPLPATSASLIAIVPVRDGSKGFPGKNTADLAGRPLYRHAVEQGLAAGAERVVVTTDIPAVLTADHEDAVVIRRRPRELTGDDVPMGPVVTDVLSLPGLADDDAVVVLLQATSPLRRPEQIREAVAQFRAGGVDLVMSVCATDPGVLKYGTVDDGRFTALRDSRHPFSNRQELPAVYRPNGAIYVFSAAWFREHRSFAPASIGAYVMPDEDSLDVDTAADLDRCVDRLAARVRSYA